MANLGYGVIHEIGDLGLGYTEATDSEKEQIKTEKESDTGTKKNDSNNK